MEITMDIICGKMSNLKVSEEILLNVDSWNEDQLNSRGMYKELITSIKVYKVYLYGGIFAVSKGDNTYIKVKSITLEERGGETFVISQF